MSNRGFSGTTVAIVVLLVVAIYGIGHIPGVNPPPEQPPKPPAAPSNVSQKVPEGPESHLKEMIARKKAMAARMAQKVNLDPKHAPAKPVQDPDTIQVGNKFFIDNPDGSTGIKKAREEFDKQKAEYDRQRKMNAQYLKPVAQPVSASPTAAH